MSDIPPINRVPTSTEPLDSGYNIVGEEYVQSFQFSDGQTHPILVSRKLGLYVTDQFGFEFKNMDTKRTLCRLTYEDGKIRFKGTKNLDKAAQAFFELLIETKLEDAVNKQLHKSLTNTNILSD